MFVYSKQIGERAIARRLPLISLFAEFPKVGSLIAYGPNVADINRKIRGLCRKDPAAVPSQVTYRYSGRRSSISVINLKTAAALGITVPPVSSRHRGRGNRID